MDHGHRKIVTYVAAHNKTYDNQNGHGTHTVTHSPSSSPIECTATRAHRSLLSPQACSIAGSVILPPDVVQDDPLVVLHQYGGMAPGAKLAIFDFNDGRTHTKIRTPKDLTSGFFAPSYDLGARVSSNSWGARNGSYIRESRDLDAFVWRVGDFLPVFAAGNFGRNGFQTVVAPSSAKNTLSVGSVRSSRIKSTRSSLAC